MPKDTEVLNIHQKILKIANAAGVLRKSKKSFNYSYVPEEEIQALVTAGMQKYGVMLYQQVVPGTLKTTFYTYQKYDKKAECNVPVNEVIVTADTIYTWVNADDPREVIIIPWILIGQMADASQAFGAGETYCNRYFLMKSLQLATTESDPDDYRAKQKGAEDYDERKILKDAVSKVVDMGTLLVKLGGKKEDIGNIVGKYNGGEKSPSSIKTLEVCAAIMEAFENYKASLINNTEKKPSIKKESAKTGDNKE